MARTRDFPDAPITPYLARFISALYAIFGGLTIVISTDVLRYAPIIRFFAYVTLAFGVLITSIDSIAGMPTFWTLFEGPTTFILGVVILLLARRVKRSDGAAPPDDPVTFVARVAVSVDAMSLIRR